MDIPLHFPSPRPSVCARLSAPPGLWVCKQDAAGREVYRYPARVLWRGVHSLTVAAVFRMDARVVGGLQMAPGDCFVETYYANRWYNIFAVYARENGRLRGWYVNIGEPLEVSLHGVAYRDLALDLVVLPDGRQVVLDMDEFVALGLPAVESHRAEAALAAAQRRFRRCWQLA